MIKKISLHVIFLWAVSQRKIHLHSAAGLWFTLTKWRKQDSDVSNRIQQQQDRYSHQQQLKQVPSACSLDRDCLWKVLPIVGDVTDLSKEWFLVNSRFYPVDSQLRTLSFTHYLPRNFGLAVKKYVGRTRSWSLALFSLIYSRNPERIQTCLEVPSHSTAFLSWHSASLKSHCM